MAWFDRCRGERSIEECMGLLNKAVEASGVLAAVAGAVGRVGRRRFVLRFVRRGARVVIAGLESEGLKGGGGPPDQAMFDAAAPRIEAALNTLSAKLPPPFTFSAGALGVIRSGQGPIGLVWRFEEDASAWRLADLPLPKGDPAPIEHPAYLQALDAWQPRMAQVRARWRVPAAHERWSLEGKTLTVRGLGGGGLPEGVTPIALWAPETATLTWLLEEPAGLEAPLVEPELLAELSQVLELVAFAATRLGCSGVFQGTADDQQLVFLGLR